MTFEEPKLERQNSLSEEVLLDIMKFSEYGKLEHETPYRFHLEKDGLELDYHGVAHTVDPESPIFEDIRSKFEDFATRHSPDDSVIVIEGGLRPMEFVKDEGEAAKLGEPGFLQYLAEQAGYRVISPEASEDAQAQAMKDAGFGADEIAVWSLLRDITFTIETVREEPSAQDMAAWYFSAAEASGANWVTDLPSKDELRSLYAKEPAAALKLIDEIGAMVLERLKQVFKSSTGVDFDFSLAEKYDDPADFSGVDSVFNRLAAISSETRDKEIVRAIGRELENGQSVFVVYGASHAVMQEPAFRKLFERI